MENSLFIKRKNPKQHISKNCLSKVRMNAMVLTPVAASVAWTKPFTLVLTGM